MIGGRLTSDPNRSSLGLLPSGPDPVGEWLVHRQPPGPYIGPTQPESKRTERRYASCPRGLVPFSSRMADSAWSLHPQLERDSVAVGELSLSHVRAMNDASYPWLILVPRHAGAVEIIDLDSEQQADLMDEIALLSRVLKDVTACDKLNVAAIGNVVPQLHIHIVARHRSDAAWPRPVWGVAPAQAYEPAALEQFIARIRGEVAFG